MKHDIVIIGILESESSNNVITSLYKNLISKDSLDLIVIERTRPEKTRDVDSGLLKTLHQIDPITNGKYLDTPFVVEEPKQKWPRDGLLKQNKQNKRSTTRNQGRMRYYRKRPF